MKSINNNKYPIIYIISSIVINIIIGSICSIVIIQIILLSNHLKYVSNVQ